MKCCSRWIIISIFCYVTRSQAAHLNHTIQVKFEFKHDLIVIPVKLANVDTFAIFDTGANINLISKSFYQQHLNHLTLGEQRPINTTFSGGSIQSIPATPIEINQQTVVLDNLFVSQSPALNDIPILLGFNAFFDNQIQINYPQQQLSISQANPVFEQVANISLIQDKRSKLLLIPVIVDEQSKLNLVLDSGFNGGVLLNRPQFKTHFSTAVNCESDNQHNDLITAQSLCRLQSASLQLGPYRLIDIPIDVPEKTMQQGALACTQSNCAAGLLGNAALKQLVLTLQPNILKAHLHLAD